MKGNSFVKLSREGERIMSYQHIALQNQAKDHIESSKVGDDICIENLSSDLPCQNHQRSEDTADG